MEKKIKLIKLNDDEEAYCPTKHHAIWSSHPKVFINIKNKTSATCPYCGTIFERTTKKSK